MKELVEKIDRIFCELALADNHFTTKALQDELESNIRTWRCLMTTWHHYTESEARALMPVVFPQLNTRYHTHTP